MGTIVKLLVMLAILNAMVRGGQAWWGHYQLQDEAQRIVQFSANLDSNQLHEAILSKAAALSIPLAPEQLDVRREPSRVVAEASYTRAVEWLPSVVYPVPFSFRVEALEFAGANAAPRR